MCGGGEFRGRKKKILEIKHGASQSDQVKVDRKGRVKKEK
jgi:hypothetical protein